MLCLLRPTASPDTSVLGTLHQVAQLLTSSQQRDTILDNLITIVTAATGAERGFLLLDQPGNGLQVEAARNFRKEEIDEPSFGASKTVIDFVSATGESQVVDDARRRTTGPRLPPASPARGCARLCVYRLRRATTWLVCCTSITGMLLPASVRPEMQLLEVVVQQAAVAIQSNRLQQKSQGSQRAAEDLKAYQDSVLKGLNTAVVSIDSHGRVVNANPAALALFEAGDKAGRGSSFRAFLGQSERASSKPSRPRPRERRPQPWWSRRPSATRSASCAVPCRLCTAPTP